MGTTNRNGKIDFLRFVFSLVIVLNHTHYLAEGDLSDAFKGFSFAVEFFFLVSGYLMMASAEKAAASPSLSVGRETGQFLWRKFRSLYPEVLIAYLIALTVVSVASGRDIFTLITRSWSEALLIQMSGLQLTVLNSSVWYVSSMLLCMAVLYPLIRKRKNGAVWVILPLITLLVFGFLRQNYGSPRAPTQWLGFTFRGNLRAMAELSLGALCYPIAQKLSQCRLSGLGKTLLTLAEGGGYLAYLWYMITEQSSSVDYFYIAILSLSLIISFSRQSWGSALFNNRFSSFAGKFSLSLYLGHQFYAESLTDLFPATADWAFGYRFGLYLALAFATAGVIYLLSQLVRKYGGAVTAFCKRKLLAAE